MKHREAVLKLVEALQMIGLDDQHIIVRERDPGDDIVIQVGRFKASKISVTIADYWAYPTLSCFFVNVTHDNGGFTACAGTPHLMRAIFDIGQAYSDANSNPANIVED